LEVAQICQKAKKMIKKIITTLVLLLTLIFVVNNSQVVHAQDEMPVGEEMQLDAAALEQSLAQPKEDLFKAKVEEIVEEGTKEVGGYPNVFQKARVRVLDGDEGGNLHEIEHGGSFSITDEQKVKPGETIVLLRFTPVGEDAQYHIVDKYRLDVIYAALAAFLILVFVFSKWRGVGSALGLLLSIVVIVRYMVPQILQGNDPLTISIISALIIMVTTMYLAHGVSKQTSVALGSTAITLILTGILSVVLVSLTNLSGLGSDDAYSLRLGSTGEINFKGLLLAGMIIGVLGVLDDITTSLSATIFEVAKANPLLKFGELFASGLRVGREHVASLVNTLVLAYAGASLPVLLFIVLNPGQIPLWTIVNSELISEEIVRTLAGSIGLLCAVPITAALAAKFASAKSEMSVVSAPVEVKSAKRKSTKSSKTTKRGKKSK
jgi:uncharacterized membrane protein